MDKQQQTEQFEYRAEMRQLLHLIIHSLYTHPEIFLRELISNASDALNKVRFLQLTQSETQNESADPELPLTIKIETDENTRTFSIEDSGIGMTRDELIERIGTVASSGTLEFLERMKKDNAAIDGNLIGQFGVGFYSVFMVTDEVVIETRHASTGSLPWRWRSGGEGTYTIEEGSRETRGTKISFVLKEEAKEFASDWRIKSIIKKYSNFVDFPIFHGAEQLNAVSALWHRSKDDMKEDELKEFYKFISNDWEDPLGHLHVAIEGRVNFKALLFVPKKAPLRLFDPKDHKGLHLYSSKVFISDDCDELLPEYLRFLKGVVDTEDLPLNVSREVTQSSPVTAKIREVLTGRVLAMLEEWAKNETEKYDEFFRQFGQLFKVGLNVDFTNRDRLVELMRFETTTTGQGKTTSFNGYFSRMKPDQNDIFYLAGEHRDALMRNPKLEYFLKNDIEVILLTDPMDPFTLATLPEYEKKKLVSIEQAGIEMTAPLDENEEMDKNSAEKLILAFKEVLGDSVADVIESKRLVSSAATLVFGKDGGNLQMERMMKMMDANYEGAKRILEINMSHPLVRNLSRINSAHSDDALVRTCILQLYEGALLMDGSLGSTADFVARMTGLMEKATA
jgi:molecular chaperone HtpG